MTANNTLPNSRLNKQYAESTIKNYCHRLKNDIGDLSKLNDRDYIYERILDLSLETAKLSCSAIKWYLNTQLNDD